MEKQVDEVDTIEIEIEDYEAQKQIAAENLEGSVDRAQMKQMQQFSRSPKGQQARQKKSVIFHLEEEEKKEEAQEQYHTAA